MRIFFILFIFLSHSVTGYAQAPKVLRIDPSVATGRPAAQIYEEVHYLPLETTRQSLFGSVNQLEISDSLYIILDRSSNSILFFDKMGKFKTKIRGRGREILSFRLEKYNDRIQVLQSNTNNLNQIIRGKAETDLAAATRLLNRLIRVTYYNFQGKSLKLPQSESHLTPSNLSSVEWPEGFSISNFALAGQNMVDSQAYELNIFKNNQLFKSELPYNTSKEMARYGRYLDNPAGFTRSQRDTIVYFTRPMNYSIYEVSPHSFVEKYQLIFPAKYTFPESYFTNNISQNNRLSYFKDNPSMITGLSNIYVRKDRLFFKINNNERNWNASNSFLYNIKTGNVISLNRVSQDSSTFFLPVTDYSFGNESFKATDADYLYSYISSRRMFQAFEGNQKREIEYPAALQQYFLKGNPKGNPVLVLLKPKENL